MPGDEEAGVRREWVATLPAVLKASTAFSGELPAQDKLAVAAGARLSARLTNESKDYWIIADAQLDGSAVPGHLRYVYRGHWQMQGAGAHPAEAPPAEALPPTQSSITARAPNRRRLYAAFRRRLLETS
jgi:hypothetical protein